MRFLLTLFLLLFSSLGAAFQLGSQQLVLTVGEKQAYLNGAPLDLDLPARVISGRTMLPLRSIVTRLGLSLTGPDEATLKVGDLLYRPKDSAGTLRGNPIDPQSLVMVDRVLFINARLLADALSASLVFSEEGRTLTFTTNLPRNVDAALPQARFLTSKASYAMGEKVGYLDYSFDPEGTALVSRRWTNKQDAFFIPGTQTITLQVINEKGKASGTFSRTIQITEEVQNSAQMFALKHQPLGTTFKDDTILSYPVVALLPVPAEDRTLVFSDSPENVDSSGILYRDDLMGKTRILAYHLNASARPARLYIQVKNLSMLEGQARVERLGETAPTRVETTLGQGTLLDFYSGAQTSLLKLPTGSWMTLYSSPLLPPGGGVNVMLDAEFSSRTQVSIFMLQEGDDPQTLTVLRGDGRHQRGTFPGAVRELQANLTTLPARLVLGDEKQDQPLIGLDATTLNTVVLKGNYGLLYRINLVGLPEHAVGALSPRGGVYKGALHVDDLPVALPESGVLTRANNPILFSRGSVKRLEFIPASGSNLPVNLVFYPTRQSEPLSPAPPVAPASP
ncbi:copper amine oxidase N-terminal domain-containing protein [Deinococcus roseus]|uniref:copper amine oxidase N-terminal domain-containing protein n=1 Tax=Deinococcus roseus TaxID=392414 RepID=UPI0016637490|nr:copper amine oxidase N-terminal domain-containing protein [Deinococcus roseus]